RGWSAPSSRLLHEDERAARPGQRPLHEEQVPVAVGADDPQLLDRRGLVAHVAGHPESLVDAAWRRAGTDRAGLAVMVGPMGLRTALEVVALDLAREALALRDTRHVDEVTLAEHVTQSHGLAELELVDAVDAELADRRETLGGLGQVLELA